MLRTIIAERYYHHNVKGLKAQRKLAADALLYPQQTVMAEADQPYSAIPARRG